MELNSNGIVREEHLEVSRKQADSSILRPPWPSANHAAQAEPCGQKQLNIATKSKGMQKEGQNHLHHQMKFTLPQKASNIRKRQKQ